MGKIEDGYVYILQALCRIDGGALQGLGMTALQRADESRIAGGPGVIWARNRAACPW
jgi:hypothetical protein